jgi:hypothetical protein
MMFCLNNIFKINIYSSFKNKNYQDDFFYNGQLDFKKKGIVGPYVSQNCLDKPEIKNLEVIEPTDLENMHNNQNNNEGTRNVHVRFKDDPTNNNKGYIDLNTSRDMNENPASLRNLKDAFNNFSNRRPSNRDNKSYNLPILPQTSNDQNDNNVYSITKSYNQNDDYNDQQQQQFQQQQPRQSFENLYSQVRVQPNRINDNYIPQNNMYGNDAVVNNEMINPNMNDDYNNQQPVYMNTSYDDYNQQQSNSQRTNSKSNRLI